jgi:hypothetical protein
LNKVYPVARGLGLVGEYPVLIVHREENREGELLGCIEEVEEDVPEGYARALLLAFEATQLWPE